MIGRPGRGECRLRLPRRQYASRDSCTALLPRRVPPEVYAPLVMHLDLPDIKTLRIIDRAHEHIVTNSTFDEKHFVLTRTGLEQSLWITSHRRGTIPVGYSAHSAGTTPITSDARGRRVWPFSPPHAY